MENNSYSEDYKRIRHQAETQWADWQRKYYNEVFATSAHAKKIPLRNEVNKKAHND